MLTGGDLRKLNNRPLKPIATRSFALAVLGVVIALGVVTTLCLVVLNQNQPSFNFMRTEELKFASVTFPSNSSAVITAKNTGTSPVTIKSVTINSTAETSTYAGTDGILSPGEVGTITISNWMWANGSTYEFVVLTETGNKYICEFTATPGGSVPIPIPHPRPSPEYSPLIFASLIEIVVIISFGGIVVLNRKHYLSNVPTSALAVLATLMIVGLLVALWLVVSYVGLFEPIVFDFCLG